MRKMSQRIVGAGLGILMIFSVSCKNKNKGKDSSLKSTSGEITREEIVALNDGKWVKEDDPYFECKEIPLSIRPEEGKTIKDYELFHMTIGEGRLVAGLYSSYTDRSDSNRIVTFNMDGEIIGSAAIPHGESLISVVNGRNGDILVMTDVESSDKNNAFMRLYKVTEGTELVKVLDFSKGVRMSVNSFFAVMEDGSYLVHDYGRILRFSPSGDILTDMTVDNSQHTMIQTGGEWYVATFEWNDDYTEEVNSIWKVDLSEGKTVGEKIRIDSKWLMNFAQMNDACYHADVNGIYKIDMKNNTESLVLSWNETDCVPGIMRDPVFQVPSADEVLFLKTDYPEETANHAGPVYSLMHLTRAKTNPYAGRRILTAAVAGEEGKTAFHEIMNSYNTDPNSKARIQIVDYNGLFGIYGATETMEDLLDRINQEIMSGNGPDILINCAGYPRFSTGERMADMNPYLNGASGITRNEYYENIFGAFETDGKLYQIPICVEISGLAINDSALGNRHGYSIRNLQSASEELPSGMTLFPVYAYEDILDMLLPENLKYFVKDDEHTCQFDSEEFCELLEFCKNCGSPKESIGQNDGAWTDPIEFLDLETVAAVPYTFNSFFHYGEYMSALHGNVLFSGYPVTEGSGIAAKPVMSAGICASSSGKDEAWDFIRYMLSSEPQRKIAGSVAGFPVQRQAFSEYIQSQIDLYESRLEGEPASEGDIKIRAILSEKEKILDGLSDLMASVNTQISSDPYIQEIIKEESAAYFAGQKSAEDVSGIIQNRAKTIVQERG